MKVCIVGASGKLGRYMVRHALDRGYEVVGVCREKSVGKLAAFEGRITVVPGQTDDPEVIGRAVAGCDGVLVVLVPWSVHGYSTGTAQAVLDHAPPGARLVFSCGWHITRDGRDVYSWKLRTQEKILGPLLRLARIADIDDQVEACRRVFESDTRWTVVRGSDLEEGESQGLPVWSRHVGDPILESNLTRRVDFALFMVAALENDELIHEAPAIVGCRTPSALAHAAAPATTGRQEYTMLVSRGRHRPEGERDVNEERTRRLTRRLEDRRGKRVVFLSHCILNENTRYLGGACGGCVREIVQQCLAADIGMVQMPCPEQLAWGGVTKRLLLAVYGAKGTLIYRLRRVLLPLFVAYTRFVYRRIARRVARQIEDYLDSGYEVIGVLGIDGSPSCGVRKSLDLERSFESIMNLDVGSVTDEEMNAIVRQNLKGGSGLFTDALKGELRKRRIEVPFLAHDLIGELDGKRSNVSLSSLFRPA